MISEDFIFGRSGRGLLTGRGFSFGRTILEKIYAAILATDPTRLIPLEYAVNPDTGEQILFQDSAATVPVTTIGDPAGAVVWGGVIVAIQTTDTDRPTWGGEGVGLAFNGVSQALRETTFTTSPGTSVVLNMTPDAPLDTGQRFFSSSSNNRQYRFNADRPELASASGAVTYTSTLINQKMQLGFAIQSGDSAIATDQHELQTFGTTVDDILEGYDIGFYNASKIYYSGSIAAIAIYDRRLTNAELTEAVEAIA